MKRDLALMELRDRAVLKGLYSDYKITQVGARPTDPVVLTHEVMERIWRELRRAWDVEDWLRDMMAESDGIAGWHQNGDILRWEQADIDGWEE